MDLLNGSLNKVFKAFYEVPEYVANTIREQEPREDRFAEEIAFFDFMSDGELDAGI